MPKKSVIRQRLEIPKSLDSDQRAVLAESVINFIRDRSIEGYDKNMDKFKKYSKSYADFKGVNVNEVDLVLSGSMLDSLEKTSDGEGFIEIGYYDSSDEAGKAEGNIIGSYGQPSGDKEKARDFLGIEPGMLDILIDLVDEKIMEKEITDEEIDQIANELATSIFENIKFE